ncbi:Uncharacterized protein Fot_55670 [Forsythia ovata]|uniref:Uncharacterized protein n=1 Tax=Forsythia ovata TaxID=205694 RepID=A0ABD1P449_9LAMI
MNAMRSGVVVMGALAFGYLTLQLGFKPFLEKAQLQQQQRDEEALRTRSDSSEAQNTADNGFSTAHTTIISDDITKKRWFDQMMKVAVATLPLTVHAHCCEETDPSV